jgi:hypothetical protein
MGTGGEFIKMLPPVGKLKYQKSDSRSAVSGQNNKNAAIARILWLKRRFQRANSRSE